MEQNYLLAPPVEVIGLARPTLLLKNVFTLYRDQFPRWFGITAPASILASAVLWVADQRITAINRSIPFGEMKYHIGALAAIMALRFGSYFVGWRLGYFALAGIATVVNNLDPEDVDSPWRHDSHQRAHEHFGAIVDAAAFTFCTFLAGMAVGEFVVFAAIRAVGWSHFARFDYGASLASTW